MKLASPADFPAPSDLSTVGLSCRTDGDLRARSRRGTWCLVLGAPDSAPQALRAPGRRHGSPDARTPRPAPGAMPRWSTGRSLRTKELVLVGHSWPASRFPWWRRAARYGRLVYLCAIVPAHRRSADRPGGGRPRPLPPKWLRTHPRSSLTGAGRLHHAPGRGGGARHLLSRLHARGRRVGVRARLRPAGTPRRAGSRARLGLARGRAHLHPLPGRSRRSRRSGHAASRERPGSRAYRARREPLALHLAACAPRRGARLPGVLTLARDRPTARC